MSEVSHMICEGALLLHFVHSLLWSFTNTMGPKLLSIRIRLVKWHGTALYASFQKKGFKNTFKRVV